MAKDPKVSAKSLLSLDAHFIRQDLRPVSLSAVDESELTPIERIALTLDGTLTTFLEALTNEMIRSEPVGPSIAASPDPALAAMLDLARETEALSRQIILRGQQSDTAYVAARSILVPSRVPAGFLDALLEAPRGIGQALVSIRAETFRELLWCGVGPGRDDEASGIICRAYRIIFQGKTMACIEEAFLAPLHSLGKKRP